MSTQRASSRPSTDIGLPAPACFNWRSTSSLIVRTWRRLAPLVMTKASVSPISCSTCRTMVPRPNLDEAARAATAQCCCVVGSSGFSPGLVGGLNAPAPWLPAASEGRSPRAGRHPTTGGQAARRWPRKQPPGPAPTGPFLDAAGPRTAGQAYRPPCCARPGPAPGRARRCSSTHRVQAARPDHIYRARGDQVVERAAAGGPGPEVRAGDLQVGDGHLRQPPAVLDQALGRQRPRPVDDHQGGEVLYLLQAFPGAQLQAHVPADDQEQLSCRLQLVELG